MNHEIMVVDANAIGMIAVLRSLGVAGYKPHAISPRADALGFKSRYAFTSAVQPEYDSVEFLPWLRKYIDAHPIRAIVCGEEFLHALSENYAEFESLIPDSVSDVVRRTCLSKVRVWEKLSADPVAGNFMPLSGVFSTTDEIESFCQRSRNGFPYFVKVDKEHRRRLGLRSGVSRVDSIDSMREIASDSLGSYSNVFWQQRVKGLQVGVSLWRHNAEIRAENMVLGLHLYPFNAGNMSLRKGWWHEEILADAKLKLAALDWNGVAMMEYIWNPDTNEFWFIELNPRYWGYLHLDLHCGKDFPRWQVDAHFGREARGLGQPRKGPHLRYAPGEVIHVASRLLSPDISVGQKSTSVAGFIALGLNPAIKADLWFRGDRALYFVDWIRFFVELPRKVAKMFRRHK